MCDMAEVDATASASVIIARSFIFDIFVIL
jgi:hypothetical protein